MAHTIDIPFFAFKVQLSEDNFLKIPLMDTQALRVNEPIHILAGKYANEFQKKILNKGEFQKLLLEYAGKEYQSDRIKVSFEKSKDKISYPAFELEFDYYYIQRENGYWGVVPTIGIDGFGEDTFQLVSNLKEAVRLDFLKNRRLKWVRKIVATIWEESTSLQQEAIALKLPSLKELEVLKEGNDEDWLSKVAKKIQIDKQVVYGRTKELDQITKALKGKFTRNILLVGASGVGKTALIWEIIHQQEKRKIKGDFWETTASTLIKELTKDTGWQDNLSKVCKEMAKKGTILYVNNLMELFEVGRYRGNNVSIAEYLLPYINRGEVTMVSECSEEELARIELNTPNYLSAFQVIRIGEPQKGIEKIIINKINDLASSRNIEISKEAIQETLRLNKRFTPYSGLPGKPIRFLESILINKKNTQQDSINRSAVVQAFCEETGMPLFMVDPSIPMDVEKTRVNFNNNVFGQEKAVDSIVNVLSSVKTALTHIGKPIASFLFVGPTGVGKTELAKVLAQYMFGSRDKMIRFDMSEYADPFGVSRLTGSGASTDGLLTSAVHQEPFCVLLFDEIEKAHSNFYDLLLQVLSEGRLTDSRGKLVNFCSTIIIMTSNIGASNLQGGRVRIKKETSDQDVTTHFMSAVQQFFRPELYNRIDEIIPFVPLSNETIRFVVEREIQLFKKLEGIHHRRLTIQLEEGVLDYLSQKGYSPQYGARQLQRAIRDHLIIPLSKELNIYDDSDQLEIKISVENDQVVIDVENDPLGFDLMMEEVDRMNLADIVSDLRRSIHKIKESNIYISLLNAIQEFERFKKKRPKQFWQEEERGKKYTNLLQLRERTEELNQEIEQLEQRVALAYMGVETYTIQLEKQKEDWKKKFRVLKIDLCIQLRPALNKCWIGTFGKPPKNQFEIYKTILNKKGIEFSYKTIWYRESLYNEAIAVKSNDEALLQAIKGRYAKKQYVEITYSMPEKYKFRPAEKGDILIGAVIRVEDPCIYLMFQEEGGMHNWKTENKKGKRTIVQVSTQEIKPPDGIHKEAFYAEPPARRDYEVERMFDKLLKRPYEIVKENYAEHLLPYLEEAFERNLERELY